MILFNQETSAADEQSSHPVDILTFVEAQQIPFLHFETPYHLAPSPGGEKEYAMLRETLDRAHMIGIAYVVIDARHHLAALVPSGETLVLSTLRWADEPPAEIGAGLHDLPSLSGLAAFASDQADDDESLDDYLAGLGGCGLHPTKDSANSRDRSMRERQRTGRPRPRSRKPLT